MTSKVLEREADIAYRMIGQEKPQIGSDSRGNRFLLGWMTARLHEQLSISADDVRSKVVM